jgi:hypothetical protein
MAYVTVKRIDINQVRIECGKYSIDACVGVISIRNPKENLTRISPSGTLL